jgi:hypothetical protein
MKEGQIYFKGGTRYCHAGLNSSAKLVASCQGLDSLVVDKSGSIRTQGPKSNWLIIWDFECADFENLALVGIRKGIRYKYEMTLATRRIASI